MCIWAGIEQDDKGQCNDFGVGQDGCAFLLWNQASWDEISRMFLLSD